MGDWRLSDAGPAARDGKYFRVRLGNALQARNHLEVKEIIDRKLAQGAFQQERVVRKHPDGRAGATGALQGLASLGKKPWREAGRDRPAHLQRLQSGRRAAELVQNDLPAAPLQVGQLPFVANVFVVRAVVGEFGPQTGCHRRHIASIAQVAQAIVNGPDWVPVTQSENGPEPVKADRRRPRACRGLGHWSSTCPVFADS